MKKQVTSLLLVLALFLGCCTNKANDSISSIQSDSGSPSGSTSSDSSSEDTSSSNSDSSSESSSSESSSSSDSSESSDSSQPEEHFPPTLEVNEFTYLIGSFLPVDVNVNFHGETFVSLTLAGEILTSYEYSINGEKISLNFSYLDELEVGDYTFVVTTTGGEVSFVIHIEKDNYVTNQMLDSERRYTGYVNEAGQPHGFGTLVWIYTNCVYTGEFLNGEYSGSGTFEWKNSGDVLIGTWKNNAPVHGMLRYSNTMRYVGGFKKGTDGSFQFHGQGVFDWNTYNADNSIKEYGWLYEGEFKDGGAAGCFGKLTYTAGRTGDPGYQWVEGEMSALGTVKDNQKVNGRINYNDKSYYIGDLWHSTGVNYIRKGIGRCFFAEMSTGLVDGDYCGVPFENAYVDYYHGDFDEESDSKWIYGNGIWYLRNKANGNPYTYIKGYWFGGNKIGAYTGNLEIDPEFVGLDEHSFAMYDFKVNRYSNLYKNDGDMDVCFAGDSFIEFWRGKYEENGVVIDNFNTGANYASDMAGYNTYNVGIGGTISYLWRDWADQLILSHHPKKVVIHLGFNDLHMGGTIESTLNNMKTLVEYLLSQGVQHVYIMSVENSPAFTSYKQKENNYNSQLQTYINSNENLTYINSNALFNESNFSTYFISDGVHLNAAGYSLVVNLFKTIVFGE